MSDEVFDPLAPQESGPRSHFGMLKIIVTPVALKKVADGGTYTIPGITDRDGNPKQWNGKLPTKGSKTTHIVLMLKKTDREGNEYVMTRDYLNRDEAYNKIVFPGLKEIFGETAKFPLKDFAPVKVEEVPTGETFVSNAAGKEGSTVNKTAFKVTQKFANKKAMDAASEDFFAQFNGAGETNGASESASPFSADMIKTFKKNAKKGAPWIVENLVDDEVIESLGGSDQAVEAVKEAIA